MIAFSEQPDPTPAELFAALVAMQQELSAAIAVLGEVTALLQSLDARLDALETF